MTETNMITSNPYNGQQESWHCRIGARRCGDQSSSLENEKEVLKNGEIGVVEVMGPNVFKGYWKQPEKTKSEFREDGFFITGDMGYLDQDQTILQL